jgi:hypothetical protein
MREHLAGIGLRALNDEDFSDECKSGKYPLLEAINQARCWSKPIGPTAAQPTTPATRQRKPKEGNKLDESN